MSDDIKFEIDGRTLSASPGQMLIEAADEAGIYIPRFCYHKHLSVAANCRMCLVEVEKSPKALPACATPITPGMKVFTRSPAALAAQKAVMEFLLINHPLDCPICDQGGECELQDLSMGFGADSSYFHEGKRAVADQDLGPLIATEMTRCIHCTRCVRFGDEVAGLRELGAINRGEQMKISTAIEKTMQSEVSGNIIDLCPVGALTSKPFRFRARAWELSQFPSIAPHDCVGSHLNVHTRSGEVMRVVPRENPAINETWLSDRDRFSYEGLSHEDRLKKPMVKRSDGKWQETDWQTALDVAVKSLKGVVEKQGADQLGALISPSATLEECYLLQKLTRGLGSAHIDHRLRETNLTDQDEMPLFPGIATPVAGIEDHDVILLVGSCLHHEQPLLATRVRKAVRRGARVIVVNMIDYAFTFDVEMKRIVSPQDFVFTLASITNVLQPDQQTVAGHVARESDHEVGALLRNAKNLGIYAGMQAFQHPDAASIRTLLRKIASICGVTPGWLTEGANAAGAWIAGAVPHRGPGGVPLKNKGLDAASMWREGRAAWLLCHIEPDLDCVGGTRITEALRDAEAVIALSCFRHPLLLETATVILPVTPFTETAGTFVNVSGEWQPFQGVAQPLAEARPAWKVLRVLNNLSGISGCDYESVEEVTAEIRQITTEESGKLHVERRSAAVQLPGRTKHERGLWRVGPVPLYATDPLVRRAASLQAVQQAMVDYYFPGVSLHPFTAMTLEVSPGDKVVVSQGEGRVLMKVRFDESVPRDSVVVPAGYPEFAALGELFGPIEIQKS